MDQFTTDKFIVTVDSYGIRVTKLGGNKETLLFQAGDCAGLTAHLSFVSRLVGLRALPKRLDAEPFRTEFSGKGEVTLYKSDQLEGIRFDLAETDALIDLVQKSEAKWKDFRTLRPGPRQGAGPSTPEPIIEGR